MKSIKKCVFCILFTILLCCTALPFSSTVSAAENTLTVSVGNATAIPGDEVVFNVNIADNPGIMAVTISVNYDPAVLEFVNYIGGFIPKDTLGQHTGYVTVVWCGDHDVSDNGRLFSMRFKVLPGAKTGKYEISIKSNQPNSASGASLNGCFANWSRTPLKATAKSGYLTVSSGKGCSHRFGTWKTLAAVCKSKKAAECGVEARSCTTCGHTELKNLADMGHTYAEEYTVDRVATGSMEGTMSRHCVRCNSTTDRIYFSVKDANAKHFKNVVGEKVTKSEWENGRTESTTSETTGSSSNQSGSQLSGSASESTPNSSSAQSGGSHTSSAGQTASQPSSATSGGQASSRPQKPDDNNASSSDDKTDTTEKPDENSSADALVENTKEQIIEREVTTTQTVSMWEYLLGKGGLFKSLFAAFPKGSFGILWWLLGLALVLVLL